jgi:O-antigen ligase
MTRYYLLVFIFLGLLATLLLQWITLGNLMGGNVKYPHLMAILFMATCFSFSQSIPRTIMVIFSFPVFFSALFVLLLLILASTAIHNPGYFSASDIIKRFAYAMLAVFVATFITTIIFPTTRAILQWAATMSGVSFIVIAPTTLILNGMNPVEMFIRAVTLADPDLIIHGLFRNTFASGLESLEDDAGGNLRHGIMGTVYTSLCLSLACRSPALRRASWQGAMFYGGAFLCVLILLFSLSRSVILCLIITGAMAFATSVVGRNKGLVVGMLVPLLVFVGVIVFTTSFGELLINRFSSTGSYEGRLEEFALSAVAIEANPFWGVESKIQSPHNGILAAWLGTGILGAAAATIVYCVLVFHWGRLGLGLLFGKSNWVLDIDPIFAFGIGTLPIVRYVTGGTSLLDMGEWVATGIFLGLIAVNQEHSKAGLLRGLPSADPQLGR